MRYKLYYRTSGQTDTLVAIRETKHLLSDLNLYNDIEEVLNDSYSGIWGIAISTNDFTAIFL